MRRLIKWIIIIVIILLIFPGILPAVDRFAKNIGLNMPCLSCTFDLWKGKTEDAIDKGKDAIDNGISNVEDFVNDIPNSINKNTKPSGTEDIDALIARIEVAEPSNIKYSRDDYEKPIKRFDGMSLRNYGTKNSQWLVSWGKDGKEGFEYKDPYTDKIVNELKKLDWDHIIPLNYTNRKVFICQQKMSKKLLFFLVISFVKALIYNSCD